MSFHLAGTTQAYFFPCIYFYFFYLRNDSSQLNEILCPFNQTHVPFQKCTFKKGYFKGVTHNNLESRAHLFEKNSFIQNPGSVGSVLWPSFSSFSKQQPQCG